MSPRSLMIVGCLAVCLLPGCASHAPAPGPAPAAGGFAQARAAYRAGHYMEALKLLEPLAQQGNADAQYTLGYMYYYGYGTDKDRKKAMEWIGKSARQGNANAVAALKTLQLSPEGATGAAAEETFAAARAAYNAKDYAEAHRIWLELAQQGNCRAELALARMHEFGIGVRANFSQAQRWYRLALDQACRGADAVIELVRPPSANDPAHPGAAAPAQR